MWREKKKKKKKSKWAFWVIFVLSRFDSHPSANHGRTYGETHKRNKARGLSYSLVPPLFKDK